MVRIKITSKQTNGSAIINAEKKIIVFFIGGAGDKNSYYGYGPTKSSNPQLRAYMIQKRK